GREWLVAPGNQDTTSRPRMEVNSSSSDERCNSCGTPPRDGGASRAVREDACEAQLVGLVRALPECPSARQQSGSSRSGRQSLHGRGPSCSSPITWEPELACRFDT